MARLGPAGRYDAIVIGGGHNGLVAAAYLARARLKVLLLERRSLVGGAAITEEIHPGFRFSRLAYVNSLFRPRIARELRLRDYGFEMLPRNPSSLTPFLDGRRLVLGPDRNASMREIARFSRRDAEAYPRYETMLETFARLIEPLLDRAPPDLLSRSPRELLGLLGLGLRGRALGEDLYRFLLMLSGSARTLLDAWFESEELKVTLATDAVIGALASPSTPGTAYVLFHHVMGESDGVRGVWGYVRGGMGGLSEALRRAAEDLGVEIRTGCAVESVLVEDGRAAGVVTAGGQEYRARLLLSNLDPQRTFLRLLPERALPEAFRRSVAALDMSAAAFKVNLALDRLPRFRALEGEPAERFLRGTIHLAENMETIERAYADACVGRPSERPLIECTIPSAVDTTLAPEGKHVMGLFVQYSPYELSATTWDEAKGPFVERILDVLEEYAPGFRNSLLAVDAISPLDLEREFGLTGGNIFHGAMTPSQLFVLRPVPGWARYRTPIAGLYLCGAGAHPGGGVLGAPGRNAAITALEDLRRRRA